MRDYEINSDLKQSRFENLNFVQYDNGSKITVNLFKNGKAADLTNCSVIARFKRVDGKEFNRNATIDGNKITTTLDSTVTAKVGVLKISFKIIYDTDKQVSTFVLSAKIEESSGEGDNGNIGGNTGDTIIDYDLSDYQKKTDNTLQTQDKTIVGAINEVRSQYNTIVHFIIL